MTDAVPMRLLPDPAAVALAVPEMFAGSLSYPVNDSFARTYLDSTSMRAAYTHRNTIGDLFGHVMKGPVSQVNDQLTKVGLPTFDAVPQGHYSDVVPYAFFSISELNLLLPNTDGERAWGPAEIMSVTDGATYYIRIGNIRIMKLSDLAQNPGKIYSLARGFDGGRGKTATSLTHLSLPTGRASGVDGMDWLHGLGWYDRPRNVWKIERHRDFRIVSIEGGSGYGKPPVSTLLLDPPFVMWKVDSRLPNTPLHGVHLG